MEILKFLKLRRILNDEAVRYTQYFIYNYRNFYHLTFSKYNYFINFSLSVFYTVTNFILFLLLILLTKILSNLRPYKNRFSSQIYYHTRYRTFINNMLCMFYSCTKCWGTCFLTIAQSISLLTYVYLFLTLVMNRIQIESSFAEE